MDRYLSIKEIAKLFHVNRQTLHYYDKIGLFKPEFRDPQNGYRKYSYQQIAHLAFIIYLRTIGFSIERIKIMLHCNDINQTMEQLMMQSQVLEAQYDKIFKMNKVIQRKLMFVRDHIINIDEITVRNYPKRAYAKVGRESDLYENEIFYYFPTVVFYHYSVTESKYDKIFGAYMNQEELQYDSANPVEYIEENRYLCLYYKGPYEKIPNVLPGIYSKYENLSLSPDFICINIVDQFLEKDPQKFITEIQIPVDCIPAI